MKVICDESKCSGCLACVVACIDQHYDASQEDAVSARRYQKQDFPSGLSRYRTYSCLHCEDAPCMKVCPKDALVRDENGFVVPVQERCIGCKSCARVCPFEIPIFNGEGKIVKCDGCSVRVSCRMEPACVRACNTGCLKLVP